MPAGLGPVAVIDTADWDLTVPLTDTFDPAGSHLRASISPGMGGSAVAVVSTEDGSLAWVLDPATSKAIAVQVHVPVSARGGWRASQKTVLGLDFHRTIVGSTVDEWFGSQTVMLSVYPGSDSALAMAGAGFLYGGRPAPTGKVILSPLQIGPQGPPGSSAGSANTSFLAGTPISGHRCVRLSNGQLLTASSDHLTDADTCFGISTGGGQTGVYVTVQSSGVMEEAGWSWIPGPIFLGLDGMLTQAPPRAAFEQRVGVAVGPTRMLVSIEPAYILAQ